MLNYHFFLKSFLYLFLSIDRIQNGLQENNEDFYVTMLWHTVLVAVVANQNKFTVDHSADGHLYVIIITASIICLVHNFMYSVFNNYS